MAPKANPLNVAWALTTLSLCLLLKASHANPEFVMGRQSRIKLNLGLHVPPIVVRLPRMELPQLTIGANLIKRPNAKPLTIQLPPLPQVSFGDSGGGSESGTATYNLGGGGGGGQGGSGGGGYDDQFSSGSHTHQKAVKLEKKSVPAKSEESQAADMRAYGSAPLPYHFGSSPYAILPHPGHFIAPPPPEGQSFALPPQAKPAHHFSKHPAHQQHGGGPMAHPMFNYPFMAGPMRAVPKEAHSGEHSHYMPPHMAASAHENSPKQHMPPPPTHLLMSAHMAPPMSIKMAQPAAPQSSQAAEQSATHHGSVMPFGPGAQFDPSAMHTPVPQHYGAPERPLMPKHSFAAPVTSRLRAKPDMAAAYSMAASVHPAYQMMQVPTEAGVHPGALESASLVAPQGPEMYSSLYLGGHSPATYNEQAFGAMPDENFSKAYAAVPPQYMAIQRQQAAAAVSAGNQYAPEATKRSAH